jgi:hypothetical protein
MTYIQAVEKLIREEKLDTDIERYIAAITYQMMAIAYTGNIEYLEQLCTNAELLAKKAIYGESVK